MMLFFDELDLYPKILLEESFPRSLVAKYYGRCKYISEYS